jgi:hypothetical protein
MSEQLVLSRDHGNEADADEESFVEAAALDAIGLPDEYRSYTPREYVEAIFGPRGSGKDVLLTRHLLISLNNGYPVFTNAVMHPERFGIENKPHPIDIQYLLRFDTSLTGSVIGISEINTWVKRKRAMSTSNLMVGDWLTQLRKAKQKVFMTTQFDYLPGEVGDQVDLEVQAQDLFFTEWGREARLAKGTTFLYTFTDRSGIFTGWKGTQWQWGLRNAQKLWTAYETDQIYDPLVWAHKTVVKGGERILDLDEGRIYDEHERELEGEQRDEMENQELIQVFQDWGQPLTELAQQGKAVSDESERQIKLSDAKLRRAVRGAADREYANAIRRKLLEAASERRLAWFADGGKSIILRKPIIREANEN